MTARKSADRGQAFPIYIVVVAALLFAALAFFAVGMAGVTRSNAQGAADAAVLAAAREARDNAFEGVNLTDLRPADWEEIANGDLLKVKAACGKAVEFAALNDATAECEPDIPGFTVRVTTNDAVGNSVVPGTGVVRGKATAKAVIEPRCSLRSAPIPAPTPTSTPAQSPAPSPGPGNVTFVCGGKPFALDPAKPGSLSQLARVLFRVRLVD
ncbi:pilus assembly protein TadG-related protein [Streptomyces sp. NPDC006430]|uniref:pilus assembly protein TadG-related protein n=1 Tax=Streptomyces sp. NPDC006430 TaxID=3154299 RepID=UPI0033B08198